MKLFLTDGMSIAAIIEVRHRCKRNLEQLDIPESNHFAGSDEGLRIETSCVFFYECYEKLNSYNKSIPRSNEPV